MKFSEVEYAFQLLFDVNGIHYSTKNTVANGIRDNVCHENTF